MFILERLPYRIDATVPLIVVLIVSSITLFLCMEVISLITKLLKRNKPIEWRKILQTILDNFYYEPLRQYGKILSKIQLVQYILEVLLAISKLIIVNKYWACVLAIIFFLFPRAFLAYALYTDIIELHRIYLFYTLLWIVIIPLIFQGAYSMLRDLNQARKTQVQEKYLTINIVNDKIIVHPKYVMSLESFNIHLAQWEEKTSNLDILAALEIATNKRTLSLSAYVHSFILYPSLDYLFNPGYFR